MPRIYLHVGAPKTGTTYLQSVLFDHRGRLADAGVLYPGRYPEAHFEAVVDLRGISFGGHRDESWQGRWGRLVEEALDWDGDSVVISHELLCGAPDETIAEAVESFAGHEVHVLYTARDLGRQVPAMWQEYVKNHATVPFDRYVRRLAREPRRGRVANTFWRQQHAAEIADRWCAHLPRERFHFITVPPPGAPPTLLWERIATTVDIRPELVDAERPTTNTSLGYPQAELLRRVNRTLGDQMPWPAYETTVKGWFAEEFLVGLGSGTRPTVPESMRDWLLAEAKRMVAAIAESGVHIVGDLNDLRPSFGPPEKTPTDSEVLDAASDALAALLTERAGRHWTGRGGSPMVARARRSGMVRALPRGVQEWLKRRVND
jgi:hypothetical protein